jgi:hypothetical protein
MSQFEKVNTLAATTDSCVVELPYGTGAPQAVLVSNVEVGSLGAFVGTIKMQSTPDLKVWTDCTIYNMETGASGNPTAAGNYCATLPAASIAGRTIFSAYTSGNARVSSLFVPYI